ncbi:MAG TPA: DNA-formamidopyrimidine glycosylase [Candidatus Tyrphobacter sp.]|nr:DNA-formamidopyrimidine glycosylase [Candidatus Tyrphobacter sp.]
MPELPEVQTIVSDLNLKALGKKITGVWADPRCRGTFLESGGKGKSVEIRKLLEKLKGFGFSRIERRGKNILFHLKKGRTELDFLVHPKMTGHFLFGRFQLEGKPPVLRPAENDSALTEKKNGYLRFGFKLDSGDFLVFSDLRRFAKIILGSPRDLEGSGHLALGPDALSPELDLKKFKKIILAERRNIKSVLLDQSVLAGLGNIYTDEILWLAGVHPLVRPARLSEEALKAIFSATKRVLKQSIRLRGTSFSDFRDLLGRPGGYLAKRRVYKRAGEACPRCGQPISRLKIGSRTAHFCPNCQRPLP